MLRNFKKVYFLPILVFNFLISANLVFGAGGGFEGATFSQKFFIAVLVGFVLIVLGFQFFSPLIILFFLLKTKNKIVKDNIKFLVPVFIILQLILVLLFVLYF